MPIRDFSVPAPDDLVATLDAIDAELAAGGIVYVHCWAGCGRTGVVVGSGSSGTAMSLARRSTRSPRRVGSAARRPSNNVCSCSAGSEVGDTRGRRRLKPYRTPLRSSLERVSEPRVECSDTPREHARRSCVLRATCVEGTLGERAAGVHTSALRRIGVRSRGFRLREHPYRRRVDLSSTASR